MILLHKIQTNRSLHFPLIRYQRQVDLLTLLQVLTIVYFFNILPVNVIHGNRKKSIDAFLDQGSSTTLCDQKLLDDLGVEGEHVTIALTTVYKTAQNCESKKVRFSNIWIG